MHNVCCLLLFLMVWVKASVVFEVRLTQDDPFKPHFTC